MGWGWPPQTSMMRTGFESDTALISAAKARACAGSRNSEKGIAIDNLLQHGEGCQCAFRIECFDGDSGVDKGEIAEFRIVQQRHAEFYAHLIMFTDGHVIGHERSNQQWDR